nr:immunoglobulin heavy chain junction region [Macaca mulatta]MOW23561.1 immunoglobulin heavy chain junction region [Macaca mulatta]MOW23583.1 immunoglobulin heavy chain junction region [Macaca mulatta]MOW23616.1 immunoglobulin heavy chain junction region [Macaca mulatta]MOW23624.1 immunoglobulin heavy chain junction region [Macaca mulatta]
CARGNKYYLEPYFDYW